MTDLHAEILRIAPVLDALRVREDVEPEYCMFSDALVWPDELPSKGLGEDVALRYLLRYRSSVIVGEPIAALEPYWDAAKAAFPNWPGFSEGRCRPSDELKSKFETFRKETNDLLDDAIGD